MAESRALEYKAKLDELTARAVALPADARAAVLKQLQQAAAEVRSALASADPASLSAARLRSLRTEVQRVMAQFAQAASGDAARAERTMYVDAAKSVDALVSVATRNLAVQPVLDQHTLTVAQGYTADLITGLSHETATKINGALQRAAMGGATHQQLVAQVGGALEGGTFSGIFSPAGERAGTIVTNEILRMHSVSSMARLTDLASRHDGIDKEWLHIPIARVPRPAHIVATGQVRAVDEPFNVGGEELMYPRDPSGSPDNTINCHCLVRPKVRPALLQPSDQERALLDKLGISVTTTRS